MRRHACVLALGLSLWAGGLSAQTSTWTDIEADVTVPAGHTVVLDTPLARVRNLYLYGTLIVSRAIATVLEIGENLVVHAGGVLDQGTAADPIADVTHDTVFKVSQADAAGFVGGPHFQPTDHGLWVMGTWTAHGKPLVRAWGKLAADVLVGGTTLTVEGDIADWPVGGTVVVTHTSPGQSYTLNANGTNTTRSRAPEHEVGTIAAVDPDTSTITLTAPVRFAHAGTGELRGEVALFTRTVTVSTQLEGWTEGTTPIEKQGRGRRFAHVMVMPTSHGDGTHITHSGGGRVDLGWLEFRHMGYYGLLGRYPLHFHRNGDNSRHTLLPGLSFYETGNRCVNRHESNGIALVDPVAFSSASGTCFMNETDGDDANGDPTTQLADIASVHSLVIGQATVASGFAGERSGRAAASFWPGASEHEAFMGDVAAGPAMDMQDAVGFHWPERQTARNGTIKRLMLGVEAHGWGFAGFHSWQNRGFIGHDIVGFKSWHNAEGILHGAYGFELRWYNGLIARQRIGMVRNVTHAHVQDTRFVGRGLNAVKLGSHGSDKGVVFGQYSIQPHPWAPSRYYRNAFSELQTSAAGEPGVAIWRNAQSSLTDDACTVPLQHMQEDWWSARYCSSAFVRVADNVFAPGIQPYRFGYPWPESGVTRPFWPNPNSWWVDHDRRLVLVRKDATVNDGPFAAALIKPSSVYDPLSDALATPCADALPVTFTNLLSYRARAYNDFTMDCVYNPPPKVQITQMSVDGNLVTLKADATADTQRVEFGVDWVPRPIVVDTEAPFEATIDLANLQPFGDLWPMRTWAYVHVTAFDGVLLDVGCGEGVNQQGSCGPGYAQRGYDWREISPEMRRQVAPTPAGPTVEQLQQQITVLTQERDTAQAQLSASQQQLQAAQATNATQAAQLASLQAQITALDARVTQLQQAIQAALTALAGVQ